MRQSLVALAALCSAAAGVQVTRDNVVVMDMQSSVRHEHREIVYQHREKLGSDPMGGNIWPVAIYWVYIEVGTPARKFPVAIDTGSFTLDIPDVACDGCVTKAPNNAYDASSSSTTQEIPCGLRCAEVGGRCSNDKCSFSNTYETCDLKDPTAPCTIKGVFRKDVATLGGATGSVEVAFGTITSQTSNFDQFKNIDGVLGLAGPATSMNTFELLVRAGKLPKNVFAMCFVEGKTSNGTITFGGVDRRLYQDSITYVPDTGGLQGFYAVELRSISVGGKAAPSTSSQRAILDSGTNILLLPTEMYTSVRTTFEGLCSGGASLPGVCNTTRSIFDKYCYDYTPQQLALFPKMSLALNGVTLEMEPRNYLLRGQPGQAASVYCLGLRDTGRGGLLIIGDSTMENYYMVMDREQKRIGWAPVNRTSCGSIGSL